MSGINTETRIVMALARDIAERITKKVIYALQRETTTLSSWDSELETAWDEICVQAQFGDSYYVDADDETTHLFIKIHLDKLQPYEKTALWLQTTEGEDWFDSECGDEGKEPPVFDDDILSYIAKNYIYARAGNWKNLKIRHYIEKRY